MSPFWDLNFERYMKAIEQSETVNKRVFPLLASQVSRLDKVLDFGGGGGLLLPSLRHCDEVWLYDPAVAAVRYASARYGLLPERSISELIEIPEGYFTAVIACFVLMSAPTNRDERSIVDNISRLLRSDGRALFVITDPRNRGEEFSTFKAEFLTRTDKQGDETDPPFQVVLIDQTRAPTLRILNFHRALDDTISNIEKAGLVIKCISPIADYASSGYYNRHRNPYLLLVAEKTSA
jgi:SAM-dependent methyltransferase